MGAKIINLVAVETTDRNQADATARLICRITRRYASQVEALIERLENSVRTESQSIELENEISALIEVWQTKLRGLGVQPKGLWLADIPRDENTVYCWKFPETQASFCHSKTQGFNKRVSIENKES